ncbi:MAG: B12-binding domain-containing radical SAM protein, partial [Candidatus Obscuribacterales bacterium]|nr:B12-binding domain-containing radical SAM protein [Candidatus Obscuribacterales bacterium]
MFSNEIRLVANLDKSRASIDVAWCYPGSYAIGMAGLGYQLVWWLLEQEEDLRVRRCFTDMAESAGFQSHLYGFTLGFELDFVNVIAILEEHGIAPSAARRQDGDPIVFGGGPVLSANPEPYTDIFDVILLGDAEATVPLFVEGYRKAIKLEGRRERLEALAGIPGVYVPSLYLVEYEGATGVIESISASSSAAPPQVVRQVYRAADDYMAKSVFLSPDTIWGATFLLEVVRSCPQECRFCLASYLTRPFRFASVDAIVKEVEAVKDKIDKVGLLGPSITEHPDFMLLAERLARVSGLKATIASVRADTLNVDLVKNIASLGQKSVTIALESGSTRLREIMKKNLSEAQIESAVAAIEEGGLTGVKLYGIAGLPYEVQDDLDETVRLLLSLKKKHKRLRFVFGLSSFVPKAQTPFQWKGRDKQCASKMEYLRKRLRPSGIDVRMESHNWSNIQALLSRGDRRLSPVLFEVTKKKPGLGAWKRTLKAHQDICPPLDYFAYRDIPFAEI